MKTMCPMGRRQRAAHRRRDGMRREGDEGAIVFDNRPIPSLPCLAFRGLPQFKFQLASDDKNPGLVAARRFLPRGKELKIPCHFPC